MLNFTKIYFCLELVAAQTDRHSPWIPIYIYIYIYIYILYIVYNFITPMLSSDSWFTWSAYINAPLPFVYSWNILSQTSLIDSSVRGLYAKLISVVSVKTNFAKFRSIKRSWTNLWVVQRLIIFMSRHQHGHPWSSPATRLYRPSLPGGVKATFWIGTELLYIGFSFCSSMWRGPLEYVTYELTTWT